MRIAWFCPDTGNSISRYISELLVPKLSENFEIVQYGSSPSKENNHLRFFIDDQSSPFDHVCYFVEDHRDLEIFRLQIPTHPGIIFASSYIMSSSGCVSLANSGWIEQIENFKNNTIAIYDPIVKHSQIIPQAAREFSFATDVVCFNPYDAYSYSHLNNPKIKEKSVFSLQIPVADEDFNIKESEDKVLAYAGMPQIPSRMHIVLEAMKSLSSYKLLWMIEEKDLQTANSFISEFQVQNVELILGRNKDNWREILKKTQVILHPLFSHQENLFPYFQISVASAKPVIVSDFGFFKSVPEDVVFKLPVGIGEVELLVAMINRISSLNYSNSKQIEYSQNFSINQVANEISGLLRDSSCKNKQLIDQYRKFIKDHQVMLAEQQLEKCAVLENVYKELGWL